jgi:hypothetical protein
VIAARSHGAPPSVPGDFSANQRDPAIKPDILPSNGEVALLTGGGIGKALALALEGFAVVVAGRQLALDHEGKRVTDFGRCFEARSVVDAVVNITKWSIE